MKALMSNKLFEALQSEPSRKALQRALVVDGYDRVFPHPEAVVAGLHVLIAEVQTKIASLDKTDNAEEIGILWGYVYGIQEAIGYIDPHGDTYK